MAGEYKSDSAPLYDEQAIVRPRPVVTASSPTRNGGGGGVPAMNGYASANGVPPSPGARSSASSSRATSPRIRADNPTQEGEVSMDSHSIHGTWPANTSVNDIHNRHVSLLPAAGTFSRVVVAGHHYHS